MHLRLNRAEKPPASPAPSLSRGVCIDAAGARLQGALDVPAAARGLVLFASDRTFGRIDPRQGDLARELNRRGLGTLLFDLVENGADADTRGDVEALTERLLGATEWCAEQWGLRDLPIGYVASGLGSAAALSASALLKGRIGALASHAGRPDLATADIGEIEAPTLLVVEAKNPPLAAANAIAAAQLTCSHCVREVEVPKERASAWPATRAICRWMEWHLGSPDVPYECGGLSPLTAPAMGRPSRSA
jgi:putative phosphoribosyl transferase